MLNSVILSYITFVYFGAFTLYLLMMVMGRPGFGRPATVLAALGLLGNTLGLVLRWIESYELGIGHVPLSNLYESLVFFAWAIMLLYLILEWRTRSRSFGAFVTPLAFLAMAYASFSTGISSRIEPLVPALKSNWLITHVLTCFFGYAAFGLSFALSIMLLIKRRENPAKPSALLGRIPKLAILDDLNYQMIVIGFLMLTLGIITGSVWANSAWGRYWGWDPKETWSLITWFIYLLVLHSRLLSGWRGKMFAVFSIVGFLCVLFTYFGVNYLPGLHSYAAS